MPIFILLLIVPLIEIGLFIQVGGLIGLWPTIALVIVTAVLGAALLRAQGFSAMARLQRAMAEGGDPRGPLAEGAMILVAGVLMLTPGFFTDTLGFLLLLPPVRTALIGFVGARMMARATTGGGAGGPARPSGREGVIEAEYEEIDPRTNDTAKDDAEPGDKPDGDSGWTRRPD